MKKSISYLLLICLLGSPLFITSCKKVEKRPIGLQLYSLRDDMKKDPSGTIEKLGKIGFSFVEGYDYENGKLFGFEPAAFKDLLEKNGLTLMGSHTGANMPDSANWNKTMAWWDKCIADFKAAGAKYLIQTWIDSLSYTSLANLKKQCEYFNAVGEKCKASGLMFGYHNENTEFKEVEGQKVFDYMIKNVDSTKVFFQLDVWNMTTAKQTPVAYIKNFPGKFILWHVKDSTELGTSGKVDFKALFDNADLSGVKYYVVEQEAYTTTPLEGVKKDFDFMKNSAFVK
jgi:sugar phosphate isomerase/epimerase